MRSANFGPTGTLPFRRLLLLSLGVSLVSCAHGQTGSPAASIEALPAGITLPVQLSRELKAGHIQPGTTFLATTTQRVPIAPDRYLRRGVQVEGRVIASSAHGGRDTGASTLTLRFTALRLGSQTLPISARTLAIANFVQVLDASVIATGSTDRGNPEPSGWTTNQVGGDQVYRSNWKGDVYSSYSHKVGFADYHGVYALPADNGLPPRALGVFSSNSAGLYGFRGSVSFSSKDRDTTLSDSTQTVRLRKGDDLLLEVLGSPAGK